MQGAKGSGQDRGLLLQDSCRDLSVHTALTTQAPGRICPGEDTHPEAEELTPSRNKKDQRVAFIAPGGKSTWAWTPPVVQPLRCEARGPAHHTRAGRCRCCKVGQASSLLWESGLAIEQADEKGTRLAKQSPVCGQNPISVPEAPISGWVDGALPFHVNQAQFHRLVTPYEERCHTASHPGTGKVNHFRAHFKRNYLIRKINC